MLTWNRGYIMIQQRKFWYVYNSSCINREGKGEIATLLEFPDSGRGNFALPKIEIRAFFIISIVLCPPPPTFKPLRKRCITSIFHRFVLTAAHCFCRGDPDDPHPDDLPCQVSIHEYCTSNIGRSVIKVLTRNEKLVSAIQKKIFRSTISICFQWCLEATCCL